jgi:2-dehydro-3-deoxyphosphogalactonate aldolase
MRAVLPKDTRVLPVGGIVPEVLAEWRRAGAAGFGLGSALHAPGVSADEVGTRAAKFVAALKTD